MLATAHINEDEAHAPEASSLARLVFVHRDAFQESYASPLAQMCSCLHLSAHHPELPHKSLQPFMRESE